MVSPTEFSFGISPPDVHSVPKFLPYCFYSFSAAVLLFMGTDFRISKTNATNKFYELLSSRKGHPREI